MAEWWNRQTRKSQKLVPRGVTVRPRPRLPIGNI